MSRSSIHPVTCECECFRRRNTHIDNVAPYSALCAFLLLSAKITTTVEEKCTGCGGLAGQFSRFVSL